jgi:hypothetical protein
MATILVNPQLVAQGAAPDVVHLQVQVQNEDWLGLFTKLQVFRAAGRGRPFAEITGPTLLPAALPQGVGPAAAVVGASVALSGKTLELLVEERFELTVTFAGSDPLTVADAATQISQQGQQRVVAWVDDAGQLAVASTLVGSGASLRIVGGDAAPVLQLPFAAPQNFAHGVEARVPLLVGRTQYVFRDLRGDRDSLYRVRFFNHLTGALSAYSEDFAASNALGLPPEQIVVGYATLVTASGRPATGRCIHLHMEYTGDLFNGAAVLGGDEERFTNDQGYAEFSLVRGQRYTVSFPGSDLFREILAPVDTSIERFNLLDPDVATGQDRFQVVVPSLVTAERRTL